MRIFWFGYACHFECVFSIIYSICAPDLVSFAPRSDSVSHPPRLAQRLRGTAQPPLANQVCMRTLNQEKVQEAADNTSQLRAEPSKLIPRFHPPLPALPNLLMARHPTNTQSHHLKVILGSFPSLRRHILSIRKSCRLLIKHIPQAWPLLSASTAISLVGATDISNVPHCSPGSILAHFTSLSPAGSQRDLLKKKPEQVPPLLKIR